MLKHKLYSIYNRFIFDGMRYRKCILILCFCSCTNRNRRILKYHALVFFNMQDDKCENKKLKKYSHILES